MEKIDNIIYDLLLIKKVKANFEEGENQGLTKKETEEKTKKAVENAIEYLLKIVEK